MFAGSGKGASAEQEILSVDPNTLMASACNPSAGEPDTRGSRACGQPV